ncbi:molybdate transport system permease protein [Stigmatella aurantiaca]|uniref:Molybdenum transport system permease n=1 Tax=Stigmatella aurantiaca TaxID=41 RepID=A0A1H8F8A4_STIAU|nr:molybdate ABC transporter permease subunit [Stigmatella aurantiaca]SEN28073.1 molybdate transport system permease protein [Stigmatella aurantiaca]
MDWSPLVLSFEAAALATLLTAVVGIGLGALLASWRFPGRELLDVLFTAPMVLPPTVLGYYVLVVIGRGTWISTVYERLVGSPIVFTRAGVILAAAIGSLPLVIRSARTALEGVDELYLDAARTLGAGALRRFFIIRLPLASQGILAGLMLGFARALGDFGVTLMLAGNIPGETRTAPLAIYDAIQANREDQAARMAIILTVFALVILYTVGRLTRKTVV